MSAPSLADLPLRLVRTPGGCAIEYEADVDVPGGGVRKLPFRISLVNSSPGEVPHFRDALSVAVQRLLEKFEEVAAHVAKVTTEKDEAFLMVATVSAERDALLENVAKLEARLADLERRVERPKKV